MDVLKTQVSISCLDSYRLFHSRENLTRLGPDQFIWV
jgi:hypothetical protein